MNYLKAIKNETSDALPLMLIFGMKNYFNLITNQDLTPGQLYLFTIDFHNEINAWLGDQYGINSLLNDKINIQTTSELSDIGRDLFFTYRNKEGIHTPITAMIILGFIHT